MLYMVKLIDTVILTSSLDNVNIFLKVEENLNIVKKETEDLRCPNRVSRGKKKKLN